MSEISGPYSPYKVVHHAGKIQALRMGMQPAPAQVQLIISDLCNQDCSFCSYRVSGNISNQLFNDGTNHNPNRRIPYEKVVEILEDCRDMGVKAIQLTGGGEPSVHPQFTSIMKRVLACEMDLAVVSNGVLWDEEDLAVLAEAAWVRVSLDAARQYTYSRMRGAPSAHFFKALAHIKQLADKGKTVLGVGFVVTQQNWAEIVEAAVLAKKAGASNFRISAAFLPDNAQYHAQHHNQAAALASEAEALSTETFKVFNLYSDRIEDLEQGRPDYERCVYQHLVTYIGGDLNVYRCCNTAYNLQGLVGSLKESRFVDVWYDYAWSQMEHFQARSCSRCQFNRQNRIGNYMLEPHPQHVAFV